MPEQATSLITIEQLAERLGTSVRHVRRLVAERRIPFIKVGRLVRFDLDDISRWIRDHRTLEAGSAGRVG